MNEQETAMSAVIQAAEPDDGTTVQVPSGDAAGFNIWSPLKAFWPWVLAFTFVVTALVAVWRQSGEQTYAASVILTATRSNQESLGAVGSVAAAAGLGSLIGKGRGVTPFEKFTYLITSPDLAQWQIERRPVLKTVFPERWDEASQTWLPANDPVTLVRNFLSGESDEESEPSAFSLSSLYSRSISRRKVGDTDMLRLIYEDTDPKRASLVLRWIVRDANEMLRVEEIQRAELQAEYLRKRLTDVAIEDYRQTLIALLARQEQTLMLAQAELPFAAERVGSSNLDALPVPRRTVTYSVLAAMIAFVLAWMAAILVYVRREKLQVQTGGA
jgi:hypothetical protein